jgi:hypothetical protein
VGVERELGLDLLVQRAAHRHVFLLGTLGEWNVQVLEIHTGKVVPLACHDDLLLASIARPFECEKNTRDYRATVPGIKRFGEQISRPVVTVEMRAKLRVARDGAERLASCFEELFQKLR